MKKSLLRFSVALFAFAAALTAGPKRAAAASAPYDCPSEAMYQSGGVWYDCIDGTGNECWNCTYYCPDLIGDANGGYELVNMCNS